ncbi:hypothetical protein D3C79_1013700 [compost metagenome]
MAKSAMVVTPLSSGSHLKVSAPAPPVSRSVPPLPASRLSPPLPVRLSSKSEPSRFSMPLRLSVPAPRVFCPPSKERFTVTPAEAPW